MNRTSSSNAFNAFNPAWQGGIRYSVSQHLLRDKGRTTNDRQIRIAQNNKEISETQFEHDLLIEPEDQQLAFLRWPKIAASLLESDLIDRFSLTFAVDVVFGLFSMPFSR